MAYQRSDKFQMRCPHCGHEFTYDNGYYDANITRLGHEIQEIIGQLAEHNTLPWSEQKNRTDWWRRAKKSLSEKQKELADLKAIRKVCDQQINSYMYLEFKMLVKEKCGEEVYAEIMEQAKENLEAYKVSGLMLREYTRSNSKSDVTSINKL